MSLISFKSHILCNFATENNKLYIKTGYPRSLLFTHEMR